MSKKQEQIVEQNAEQEKVAESEVIEAPESITGDVPAAVHSADIRCRHRLPCHAPQPVRTRPRGSELPFAAAGVRRTLCRIGPDAERDVHLHPRDEGKIPPCSQVGSARRYSFRYFSVSLPRNPGFRRQAQHSIRSHCRDSPVPHLDEHKLADNHIRSGTHIRVPEFGQLQAPEVGQLVQKR